MAKLTKQQADPHPGLVQCRTALENVLKLTRGHAAAICSRVSDSQVDAILAAGDDAGKVQKAVEGVDQSSPQPLNPEVNNTKKK